MVERLLRDREGQIDALLHDVEQRASATTQGCAGCAPPARFALLLAQLHWQRAEIPLARDAFERALTLGEAGGGPSLLRRYAAFEREQRALPHARELLERALAQTQNRLARAELAGQIAELCLELGDSACAQQQYDALARAYPSDLDRTLAYPRALAARREYAEATASYQARLASWRGGPQGLARIHLELGRTRLADGALSEARDQLERARQLGSGESAELLELLLETHRGLGSLAGFARALADSAAPEAQIVAGRALEELAQPSAALATYQRALARRPEDAALAERVLALLQREGKTSELISTYQRLLQREHPEPRLLAALTELLRQLGKTEEALEQAARSGREHPRDVELHELLVELYMRWELPERARAEQELLARIDPEEPRYVLALAEAELAQGNESRAVTVLRRLRAGEPLDARAHVRLGRAFADHELDREALTEYEAALRLAPADLEAMRGRATALARLFRYRDAQAQWEVILQSPEADPERRRDAREQLVQIWSELGELEGRVRDYEGLFGYVSQRAANEPGRRALPAPGIRPPPRGPGGDPPRPDPEAGRMLAEAYLRLARQPLHRARPARYLRSAEDVLGRVVSLDPTDSASWRALERLRVRRGDRDGAIEALEQLARLEPQRAVEHWMRMAEHARADYRDQVAIAYAARALVLAPSDPNVHEWLGDMQRARRQLTAALGHYLRALDADPQRYALALRVAELQLQRGEYAAASRQFTSVLRGAADPALLLSAGRAALQAATTRAQRQELERSLISLLSSDPRRPELRRLLIELYDTLLPELIAQGQGQLDDSLRARAQRPLLDALIDSDEAQVRSALRLLEWFGTPAAALPLMALAESGAEISLRRSALAISCALGGEGLLARQLALGLGEERELRDVAAYCVARSPTRLAGPALRKLAASESPGARAYALLGLGKLGALDEPTSLANLRTALSHDPSAAVRGSAAIALGLLGEPAAREALVTALRVRDRAVAESATLGLGLLGDRAAAPELAAVMFEASAARLRPAAELALHALGCEQRQRAAFLLTVPEPRDALERVLADARAALAVCRESSLDEALEALASSSRRALTTEGAPRTRVLDWLQQVASADEGSAPAQAFREELLLALVPELPPLVRHPRPGVRLQVARVLAHVATPAAESMLLAMVVDPSFEVQAAALDALALRRLPDQGGYFERLAAIADSSAPFGLRRSAVLALGSMQGARATRALLSVLVGDPFAIVRESAAEALAERESDLAGPALLTAARTDVEPRVRLAAARSLVRVGGAPLRNARADQLLEADVRAILQAASANHAQPPQ